MVQDAMPRHTPERTRIPRSCDGQLEAVCLWRIRWGALLRGCACARLDSIPRGASWTREDPQEVGPSQADPNLNGHPLVGMGIEKTDDSEGDMF